MAIQPLENLTAPMWDYHKVPVWSNGRSNPSPNPSPNPNPNPNPNPTPPVNPDQVWSSGRWTSLDPSPNPNPIPNPNPNQVWSNGRWTSLDCTHFCYSPRFWDRRHSSP